MIFRHLLRAAAIAIALPFTLSSPVFASPATARPLWISTYDQGGYVHLRKAPSTRARILDRLSNATKVESLQRLLAGDDLYWYQVDTGEEIGWVRSDFVIPVGPLSPRASLTCEDAIAQADARLSAVPRAQLEGSVTREHSYTDGPLNRDKLHVFGFSGPAQADIMSSFVMQSQIAGQVIENCPDVGLVRFVVHQTDWYFDYGLMYDGMIQAFRCDEDWELNLQSRWGERACF